MERWGKFSRLQTYPELHSKTHCTFLYQMPKLWNPRDPESTRRTLFTPFERACAPTSHGMHSNTFILAAKVKMLVKNNNFLGIHLGSCGASRDLEYAAWAVWSNFMFLFLTFSNKSPSTSVVSGNFAVKECFEDTSSTFP